jgi:hypothetical protein
LLNARGERPIKVGVISPLTGAWTVYGKAHSEGFELGVEEINAAGGVLGRKMEIVLADSRTEPRIVGGSVTAPGPSCRYRLRCPFALPACAREAVRMEDGAARHLVRCLRHAEFASKAPA